VTRIFWKRLEKLRFTENPQCSVESTWSGAAFVAIWTGVGSVVT